MDLYKEVRSRRRIWRARTEVHAKAASSKAAPTRDEARIYALDIPRNVDRICRKLREDKFIFQPQKGILLKKSGGRKRPVVVAPIESRIVQRCILDTLQRIPDLLAKITAGYNFGGVPGKNFGVPNAIAAVQVAMAEHPFFIRTDVKSFFDRVKKERAIAEVLKYSADTKFNALFKNAVETEIADAARLGPDIALFPLYDEGVAQGSCLSPLLCNLLLSDFDEKMNARGVVAIRYIDDILFLGKNKRQVFAAFSSAQQLLREFNLECYDPRKDEEREKAEHGVVSQGFNFLGCEIKSGRIRPSAENRRELLGKVKSHFGYSLSLLSTPRDAFKKHATYAETLLLVSKTVQGWANTFGFCTDDRVMGSLDVEISRLLKEYSAAAGRLLRRMGDMDRRRGIGVFSIEDRREPLLTKLLRAVM